jgi:hypothetical protein
VSDIATKYRLHDISSIKAVHTIHSDVSRLPIGNSACPLIDLLARIYPMIEAGHKVIESMKLILDLIYQFRKIFPLHLSALVMKIEPNVLNQLILQLCDYLCECRADPKLRSLFVD